MIAFSGLPSLNALSPSCFLPLSDMTTTTRFSGLQRTHSLRPSILTSQRPASESCDTTFARRPFRSARLFKPLMSTTLPTSSTPGAGAFAVPAASSSACFGSGSGSSTGGGSSSLPFSSGSSSSKDTSASVALASCFPLLSSLALGPGPCEEESTPSSAVSTPASGKASPDPSHTRQRDRCASVRTVSSDSGLWPRWAKRMSSTLASPVGSSSASRLFKSRQVLPSGSPI
mmetsp:Transcript_37810/g.88372  ORF Transcript_37810/g.88372 Transcript_37810/m.88372 type:complete len:230 (-) Transcript_37810:2395-3084(-)